MTAFPVAGDLALMHRPERGADWVLVLAAYGVYTAAVRLPSPAVAGLAVVLGLVEGAGSTMVTPLKGMPAVALFELAVRRPARESLAGAAAFALAVACGWIGEPPGTVPPALFRVAVFLTVLLLAGAYIRSVRAAARAARERATAEARAARTAERTAIARELHDLVAHRVSSMVLRVGVARHVLPDSAPEVGEVLDDLHATGTAALDDLGHLVAVLRDPATARGEPPPIEPEALPAALARVVERWRSAGMAAEASIDPAVARLDSVPAARLGGARQRRQARRAGATVHLVIQDDGHGAPGDPGHGLTGMRERVDLLGGTFEAGPTGSGWRLAAELPLPVTAPP
ncbi:histidine kinase [Actinomadura pelletieri DSM 43383]|uniref:histidine kinase n=1 Tax=Actinomadura pelletieri DSM 43383 TaxID=1120940 RepID=A0A495QHL1_9ACTN|nr:histidine kinase [Actinomadura pelletieri]RKS71650.1 histidine kinase [Actinomadura pelletieri DSM 43383]